MLIRERLRALRSRMDECGITAWLIPSSDPHLSEYPPARWRSRAWMSGFDGSAGTLLVTLDRAALWTDSRYHLHAEKALAGTAIELFRAGDPGVPDYPEWLAANLKAGDTVGYAASCVSLAGARALKEKLDPAGILSKPSDDLLDSIWPDRPDLPVEPVTEHPVRYAGSSRGEKLSALRARMDPLGATCHLISTLDDIAWLLNIRGRDVEYNPVALCHLLALPGEILLFIDERKLPDAVRRALESDGVSVRPYGEIAAALSSIPQGSRLLVSPEQVNEALVGALQDGVQLIERLNPTTEAKARKSAVELDHVREVMVRDGVAMVSFLHWLGTSVGAAEVTELDAEERLRELRSRGENYVGESFRTISAYRGHGAIVHYASSPQTNCRLEPAGLYLVDSGAQYLDGTTDITRTVALGEPGAAERRDFTLVLKGHIGLATIRFPVGTAGPLLDVLAREHLWREGMSYGHGTGHGVGFHLHVHEGPQRIAQVMKGVALEPGMIVSNEPGVYRAERYGIRIENLVAVVEDGRTEFGSFLRLETLTLCPIDRRLIDVDLLSAAERSWVDEYHRRVRDRLLGRLEEPVAEWLEAACAPL